MRIDIDDSGGDVVVVSVEGDVDLSTSRELQGELRRVMGNQPRKLIVDLSDVPYMDSSGVATLVETMQLARRGETRLVLASMKEKVRSIFEIARLDSVFTIVDDLDTARAV
jgi:anti-sigma B factor antagonist